MQTIKKTEIKMIAEIKSISEDGFEIIGFAHGHDWDIITTTPKAVKQIAVGDFVWCKQSCDQDFGIHLKEIPNNPLSNKIEFMEQERNY